MRHGFLKTAAATPKIRVADPEENARAVCRCLEECFEKKVKLAVLPELCLTAFTCQDLFLQERLLEGAREALKTVAACTKGHDTLVFVGLPFEKDGKLYNVAAALQDGKILGFVPKRNIPNYAEFYEVRHFAAGGMETEEVDFDGEKVPFGANLLFVCTNLPGLVVGCEICEDVWYASAGDGESTQDLVFAGHNMILENGSILAQARLFENETVFSELDLGRLRHERRRMTTFLQEGQGNYVKILFTLRQEETSLTRTFPPRPFVPADEALKARRCEEILAIQAMGLKKRYEHTGSKSAVIGVSGGLDSTLALLVTARAFDLLGMERSRILSVTMPCFGTTSRTYDNACRLAKALGSTLQEVNIREAVKVHFKEIGQDENCHDVTYENGQARERTQVLMDLANQRGGLVIGTGDMSELALGWATYNGDHMSMYGVNAGVPKTLVRHLVQYSADTCQDPGLREVLLDVLDTPVSPELLPPVDGVISQKTEDLVGPYELHDFFLYYMLRCGFSPAKVYRVAAGAFADSYGEETVRKWLKIFYRRFFGQQFKRSCLPDGPKVGSVALSPRGDLRMPSDASLAVWQKELDEI